ncbi:hypothetical protein Kpol_1002p15 [Vanderwaltozyma polyspora DSM 70294]|uniref:Rhomboid-type serine protease 2 n=1 Tax=Vanderwaltozyma polyspora (strain ATCC 22028 / DSM 70294 / BCRC 21397 / CBS 2163 / NBRC 10782 / NRRL Y-8283 / UCD 57-17) TaxID=436907 RepID=A7TE48_VANPO|nr:uncharacterized protein Kpol_1002p15 [Vanderwaltozyma polyspora DSM 70294]EDO19370.1 hypothetical protein Kpol_1002p15 [Vanderwaltozyma polyspora DSM 70294]
MFNVKRIVSPNNKPPSAVTVCVLALLIVLYVVNLYVNINDNLGLRPSSLFDFELSRLSLYPLAHLSIIHLVFNVISLFPLLNLYESTHGTVMTAVTLNITAVAAGVMYCIVGSLLYPDVGVAGSSGWFFSLLGYYSFKEASVHPRTPIFKTHYTIPTQLSPLILIVVIFVLIPHSSFWGHFFGLLVGYFMGWRENWFVKLLPPSWIIVMIETKLDFLIRLIPGFVKYYKQQDVENNDQYISIYEGADLLPSHNEDPVSRAV